MLKDDYARFLKSKRILAPACGFEVPDSELNPMLFPFQRDITRWALKRGKAAIFAHTGLGKGPMQLEWLHHVAKRTDAPVLLPAPLAVAEQFQDESEKFHYNVTPCESQEDVKLGINITNYERLHLFDFAKFSAVAMDESSCIKDWTSKTTQTLTERLKGVPYKLCSTATPSPNDHAELGTHAELLDVMQRSQMLAMFFEHSGKETSKWHLKGHGRKPFFQFVSSWAVCVVKPSDLGYDDTGYDLPKLNLVEHVVPVDQSIATEGMLFRCPDLSSTGLHKEMRLTAENRAMKAIEILRSNPNVPWFVWCNTDYEAAAIKALVPEIVEVRGPEQPKAKAAKLMGFARGEIREMLSKPSIAGYGLNLQVCWNTIVMGLSYSFEDLFQVLRRFWRFGQTHDVNAHLIYAETEGPVLQTIRRKERQYEELQAEMNAAMRIEQLAQRQPKHKYNHTKKLRVPAWLKTQNEDAL